MAGKKKTEMVPKKVSWESGGNGQEKRRSTQDIDPKNAKNRKTTPAQKGVEEDGNSGIKGNEKERAKQRKGKGKKRSFSKKHPSKIRQQKKRGGGEGGEKSEQLKKAFVQ